MRNKSVLKRIGIALAVTVTALVLLFVALGIYRQISYRQNLIACDALNDNGPWGRGGIWCSNDDKYYLATIEGTSMVCFYANINDSWLRSYIEPYARHPSGKCTFNYDGTHSYTLHWRASAENDVLTLVAESYPYALSDEVRLPCEKKIVFRKSDKTADELPFAEDFKALCAHVNELMENQ